MKDFQPTLKTIFEGHHKATYRGVKTIKCPFDYLIYQMIVFEIKPDLIIEIGSNKGGGALYLADLLNIIGGGLVHAIDIEDNFDNLVKNHNRIEIFTNGYQAYDINVAIKHETILVIEDASHMYEDSFECLKKFSPIVSKDSYYIVEDGIIDKLGMKRQYNGGPKRAIKDFLKENNEFAIDSKWCNFFGINATFNINGYLKRIKHLL